MKNLKYLLWSVLSVILLASCSENKKGGATVYIGEASAAMEENQMLKEVVAAAVEAQNELMEGNRYTYEEAEYLFEVFTMELVKTVADPSGEDMAVPVQPDTWQDLMLIWVGNTSRVPTVRVNFIPTALR